MHILEKKKFIFLTCRRKINKDPNCHFFSGLAWILHIAVPHRVKIAMFCAHFRKKLFIFLACWCRRERKKVEVSLYSLVWHEFSTSQDLIGQTIYWGCPYYRLRSLAKQGDNAPGSVRLSARPSVRRSALSRLNRCRSNSSAMKGGQMDGRYQVHYLPRFAVDNQDMLGIKHHWSI